MNTKEKAIKKSASVYVFHNFWIHIAHVSLHVKDENPITYAPKAIASNFIAGGRLGDLMRDALHTLLDRKSRLVAIEKLPNKMGAIRTTRRSIFTCQQVIDRHMGLPRDEYSLRSP